MKTQILDVTVMTCGGCVKSIDRTLRALPGMAPVAVSLQRKQVEVDYDETRLDGAGIRSALESAGYGVDVKETASCRGGCCCH